MLTHVDLFSGIGGFALAAGWAGFQTVAFVEIDPYCQAVLKKHWPQVPIVGDIRDFKWPMADAEGRQGDQRGGRVMDGSTQSGRGGNASVEPSREITLLTGGFPCQPFSVAGKRRGKDDDRFLWPEMLRVIKEVKPHWIIGENVGGIRSMVEFNRSLEVDCREYTRKEMASGRFEVGRNEEREGRGTLDKIMEDLEEAGYEVTAFVIPACAVAAPHRRDRVWIVAHRDGGGCEIERVKEHGGEQGPSGGEPDGCRSGRRRSGEIAPHREDERCLAPCVNGRDKAGPDTPQRGIVAHSAGVRSGPSTIRAEGAWASTGRQDVADGGTPGLSNRDAGENREGAHSEFDRAGSGHDWRSRPTQPRLGDSPDGIPRRVAGWGDGWEEGISRVAKGVEERVNKLKALGNAIVPQVAYEIIRAIAEIEK